MLDNRQIEAVNHTEGPCMVLAGPGSGKTTVIVSRIKALLDSGVSGESILVITFTRAAASEMKIRYQKAYGNKSDAMVTFGTFHSVFFHILSKYYRFSGDSIVNVQTRNQIFRAFCQKNGIKNIETNEDYDYLALEISNIKCGKYSLDDYMPITFSKSIFEKAYKYYNNALQNNKLIDFDDMVLLVQQMFLNHPDRLEYWRGKFKYFLIDEFQDIARNQYETIKLMCQPSNNIFIVGDDDQSIYGFRGASPEIMLGFKSDFEGCKTIVLSANYRCTGNILAGAMALIKNNETRYKKEQYSARGISGSAIHINRFEDVQTEMEYIFSEIERQHREKGVAYSEMAILYRVNSQIVWNNKKIEAEVDKDIVAYLKIATKTADRGDYLRVINKPYRGILRDAFELGENFDGLLDFYKGDQQMIQSISKFKYCIEMAGRMSPFPAINFLRNAVGYQSYIKKHPDTQKRESYLQELENILEIAKTKKTMQEMICFLVERINGNEHTLSEAKDEGVNILTMHGAKGLEYKIVFIPQVNESLVPMMKEKTKENLEEERRLMYVAMTRAKDELYISYVNKKADRLMSASRFIYEINDLPLEHKEDDPELSYKQDA